MKDELFVSILGLRTTLPVPVQIGLRTNACISRRPGESRGFDGPVFPYPGYFILAILKMVWGMDLPFSSLWKTHQTEKNLPIAPVGPAL